MTALAACARHRCTPGNCSPANRSRSSRSSPKPLITVTTGSHSSRIDKTACLQFQLREYQKRNWNRVPHCTFSASTAAKNSSKVIFLLWSKTSLALQNAFVPQVPEQNNPELKHLPSVFYSCIINLSQTSHSSAGVWVWLFFNISYIFLFNKINQGFPKRKIFFFPLLLKR